MHCGVGAGAAWHRPLVSKGWLRRCFLAFLAFSFLETPGSLALVRWQIRRRRVFLPSFFAAPSSPRRRRPVTEATASAPNRRTGAGQCRLIALQWWGADRWAVIHRR